MSALMTPDEVAVYLRRSVRTVSRYRERGLLRPAGWLLGRPLYRRRDVVALVQSSEPVRHLWEVCPSRRQRTSPGR